MSIAQPDKYEYDAGMALEMGTSGYKHVTGNPTSGYFDQVCARSGPMLSACASARLWDGSRKDPTAWRVACPLPAQQRLLVTAVLAPHVVAAVHDQCPSHLAWEQVCDGDRCCPRDCKAAL